MTNPRFKNTQKQNSIYRNENKMVNFVKDKIRKIARTNVDNLFSTTIDSIIGKTFEFEVYADEYLITTHFAFREMLNKTTGTGRGITGFSELWYFLYIKKFLEKFLKIEFVPIRTATKTVHHHYEANCKGNKLVLSSDISIESNFKLKISNKSKIKPDIFIGIKKNTMEIIPVAIFEIKLYQESPQDIEGVVDRFVEMKNTLNANNTDLPFFIFLYLQHSQYESTIRQKQNEFNVQLERFKRLFGEDVLVINRISKWDKEGYENKIEGSIHLITSLITDKIVSLINII